MFRVLCIFLLKMPVHGWCLPVKSLLSFCHQLLSVFDMIYLCGEVYVMALHVSFCVIMKSIFSNIYVSVSLFSGESAPYIIITVSHLICWVLIYWPTAGVVVSVIIKHRSQIKFMSFFVELLLSESHIASCIMSIKSISMMVGPSWNRHRLSN